MLTHAPPKSDDSSLLTQHWVSSYTMVYFRSFISPLSPFPMLRLVDPLPPLATERSSRASTTPPPASEAVVSVAPPPFLPAPNTPQRLPPPLLVLRPAPLPPAALPPALLALVLARV